MSSDVTRLSEQAFSILARELRKRRLNVTTTAHDFYIDNVQIRLRDDRSLLETYNQRPSLLDNDIKAFISSLLEIRESRRIRVSSIDETQLKLAIAKCGPHRLRC